MLPDLRLKNYRAFEDYTIENLGQVNVLVGLNNSGKSSILEAVRIFVEKANPWVLGRILNDRGEVLIVDSLKQGYPSSIFPNVSHLFPDHCLLHNKPFGIESKEDEIFVYFWTQEQEKRLKVRLNRMDIRSFEVSGSGAFEIRPIDEVSEKVVSIPPSSLSTTELAKLFGKAVKSNKEDRVYSTLRILDENVVDIHTIPSERTEILVGLKGKADRVHLGSLGDGMKRVLALAVGILAAENSILLVDEIDSGLHMSVIAKVWEMLIKTAKELNVQIFATTHSYDCLKGLADCIRKHPGDCDGVRVHRIDRSLPTLKKAITFPADQIEIAMKHNIEIRG